MRTFPDGRANRARDFRNEANALNILITGAAGFLGSVLTGELLAANHTVYALDNFMYGGQSLAHLCHDDLLHVTRGDARDEETVNPLLAKADIIIPLAAIVGAPACERNNGAARSTNLDAISKLCHSASWRQWIIYPNTNSGYGVGGVGECDEKSPLEPISWYGKTKCWAENHVRARENSIVLRLATVFGCSPRMRTDLLVNDFVQRAVRDRSIVLFEPHFRRNFVHVRDVSRAFLHAIDNFDNMKGNVYNCGDTDANMTKAQLCAKIRQHVPGFEWFVGEGHDVDKRDYIVSNRKIEATGWKPQHTIDDGICELVKFFGTLNATSYGNA